MIDIAPRQIAEPELLQHMQQMQYDQKMGLTSVKFDAAIPAAWWWDWRVNRYRSFESGQFVPLRTVYDLLEGNETVTTEVIQAVSQAFFTEEINMSSWYLTMRRHLTRLHVQNAAMGAGGYDQLTQEDFWRIDQMLKDDAPRLMRFGRQIQDGLQSEKQIANRINMYAGNARIQFFRAQKPPQVKENETVLEKRKLNPADHCSYCVYLQELGWQPYGTLPVPGESDPNWTDDQCFTNCKCDLLRQVVTREDAASMLGKDQKAWVADSFLFSELSKAIFNWTEDLHPRWPEGTPVDPFGGEGGGRFMTKPESEKEAIREAYRRKQQAAGEGGGKKKRAFSADAGGNYAGNNASVLSAIRSMENPTRKKQYMRQSTMAAAGLMNNVSSEFISFAEGITPGIFDTKPGTGKKKKRKGFGAAAGFRVKPPGKKKKAKAPEKEKKDKPEKEKKEPTNVEKDRFLSVRNGMRFLRNTNQNLAAMVAMFGGIANVRGMNFQSDIDWLDERGVDYQGSMEFRLESGNSVAVNWETADNGGVTVNSIHFQNQSDADGVAGAMKEMADKGGAPIQINDDGLADLFRSKGWITEDNLYRPKRIGSGPRSTGLQKSAPQFWVKAVANWEGVLRDEKGRWKDTPGRGEVNPVIAYTFWGDRPRYETLPWRKGELADLEHFGLTRPDIDKIFAPMLKEYDLDAKIAVDLDEHDDLVVDGMLFDGGDNIGAFTFIVREVTEGGDLVCNWDFASIHQDKPELSGAGSLFAKSLLGTLKNAGYETVRILADVSIGTYAWAKSGFKYAVDPEFKDHYTAPKQWHAEKFKDWAGKLGIEQYVKEWPAFDDPQQWAEYDIPDAPRVTASQIVNTDVPTDLVMPIGKAFMLDRTGHGPWNGVLSLRGKLPARLTKAAKSEVWADHTPVMTFPVHILVAHGEVTGASDAFFWPDMLGDETSSQSKAAPKDVSHVWRDASGRWVDTPGIGDDAPKVPEKPKTKEEADAMWAAYLASQEEKKYKPRFNYGDIATADPLKILPTDIQNEPEGVSVEDMFNYWDNYMVAHQGEERFGARVPLHRGRLEAALYEVMATEVAAGNATYESIMADLAKNGRGYKLNSWNQFARLFPEDFTHRSVLQALPEMGEQALYKMLDDDSKLLSMANLYEDATSPEDRSLKDWIKWQRKEYRRAGHEDEDEIAEGWFELSGDPGALVAAVDRGYQVSAEEAIKDLSHNWAFELEEWNSKINDAVLNDPKFNIDEYRAQGLDYTHDKFDFVVSDIMGRDTFNNNIRGQTAVPSEFYRPQDVRRALFDVVAAEGLDYGEFDQLVRDTVGGKVDFDHQTMNEAANRLGGFEGVHAADFLMRHSRQMKDYSFGGKIDIHPVVQDALDNKMTLTDLANTTLHGSSDKDVIGPYATKAFQREEFDGIADFNSVFRLSSADPWGKHQPRGTRWMREIDIDQIGEKFNQLPDATLEDAIAYEYMADLAQFNKGNKEKASLVGANKFAELSVDRTVEDVREILDSSGIPMEEMGPHGIAQITNNFGPEVATIREASEMGNQLPLRALYPEISKTMKERGQPWSLGGVDAYTGEQVMMSADRQYAYETEYMRLYGEQTNRTEDLLRVQGEKEAQKDIISTDVHAAIEDSGFWKPGPGEEDFEGPDYDDASAFIHQWAESSNGSDMRSMAVQEEAAKMFGVDLTEWQEMEIAEAIYNGYDEALFESRWGADRAREYIRVALADMYKRTQDWFGQATMDHNIDIQKDPEGREYVRLYRGVKLKREVWEGLEKDGDIVKYQDNALSSWAIAEGDAYSFANPRAGVVGVVLSAMIPVDKVLSCARTGFGCLGESEFVVIGQNGDSYARVEKVKEDRS